MGRDVPLDETLIGRTIAGKYVIEEPIGSGAMGAVYKARQTALDKIVALKVLHREIQKDKQFALRFKREAKAASRLDHPSSLRVLDFGEEPDGLLYMAMEYLDGTDLFDIHKKNFPLPAERIASILSQALAALAVAHDQGVIHRDLKPENIMVLPGKDDEGRPIDLVKVCDFGIAKIVDDNRIKDQTDASGRLSTRGLIVGTPEYMSPEQGRGEPLDARSDIYSMGVILYQLITGEVPFEAENAIGVVLKHVTEEPRRPSSILSSCDARLEAIALKAMQKRKEDRWSSAREMRAALRPLLDPNSLGSHPEISMPVRLSPNQMESAATVAVPAPAISAPGDDRKQTLSDVEGDIQIPQKRPSWAVVILVPLVLGTLGGIAFLSFGRNKETANETPQDHPSASVSAAPPASSTAPAASVSIEKPKPSASVAKPPPTVVKPVVEAGAPEPIDPDAARVSIAAIRPEGTSDGAVRAVIDVSKITGCYQTGLRNPGAKGQAFKQTLEIETDESGTITSAAMPAPTFLTNLQSCFVKPLIGKKIAGAANAKAQIDLAFSPR